VPGVTGAPDAPTAGDGASSAPVGADAAPPVMLIGFVAAPALPDIVPLPSDCS
jgi:hypothetical protein